MSDYEPWDTDKSRYLHATAINVSTHEHLSHSDRLVRDKCGACALRSYTRTDAPNHPEWLRAYVQLGWPVPRQHYATEIAYAKSENRPYHDAIMRDIATWGIKLTGK